MFEWSMLTPLDVRWEEKRTHERTQYSKYRNRFVQSLLFEIKPNDPLALALAITALIAAALIAGGIPARRASRIDPMSALRHE
jgi:ABC-type lipoprotein release transport system permease subunit